MEQVATIREVRTRGLTAPALPAIGTWLLGFGVVTYLALQNGGYDLAERSEIGLVAWWVIALGVALGVLVPRWDSLLALPVLLLAGFALWTFAALIWSGSAERTVVEVSRLVSYLGVLVLALVAAGNGRAKHLFYGVVTGVCLIATIAVLSRLEPTLFPERISGQFLNVIEIERRLAYPLNYSSGLGAFVALGVPLLLGAVASARTAIMKSVAAMGMPVLLLALWLTASGLSMLALTVGVVMWLALSSNRLSTLATALVGGLGGALLCAAASQREALDRGLPTTLAQQQGDELMATVVIVCLAVALLQGGVTLVERYTQRPRGFSVALRAGGLAVILTGVILAIAWDLPGEATSSWEQFKSREGAPAGASRGAEILELSGSGRYQQWQAALDANASDPWIGIGPGGFEYWWAAHGSYAGFVRDAHSLYLETLAELGIVGLLLIAALIASIVVIGTKRVILASGGRRARLAAATAAAGVFAVSAGFDWLWELSVLPATLFLLAAVIVADRPSVRQGGSPHPQSRRRTRLFTRALVPIACLIPMTLIALPLIVDRQLESSRASAANGELESALEQAQKARIVQPYAAAPLVQEALVLELQGRFGAASSVAADATQKEPLNWRNWLVLMRLEARSGDTQAAAEAYRQARALNPRSQLFSAQ